MVRDIALIKQETTDEKCNMSSTENKAESQAQQDKRLEEGESDSLMRAATNPVGNISLK